jgi:hypothetical protein
MNPFSDKEVPVPTEKDIKANKLDDASIKSRIKTPMTGEDLERCTGVKPEDIIKYSTLDTYKSVEDLLPADGDFKIILIEDKYNSGHWVAIFRRGKTIEYFNSYGAKWDTDWKFINRMVRLILDQNTNEMTRLMDKAEKDGWKVIWNKRKFQKMGNNIQTCGRWVSMRIETFKMGYDLADFDKMINRFKQETGGNTDWVVARYIK